MSGIRQLLRGLAHRNRPFTVPVRVDSVERLSAGFVRVTVSGEELERYDERHPADAFKLFFPPAGASRVDYPERGPDGLPYWPAGTTQPVLRAFTVRSYDASRRVLRFDVADHSTGYAIGWLAADPVGSVVALSGMRRDFAAGAGVVRHVFAGDTSALPAIAACVEALPSGTAAEVHLPDLDASDRELLPLRDGLVVRFEPDLVAGIVRRPAPSVRTQVWVAGEAALVREIRRHVIERWGVDRDDLHASAYWKARHDNTQFDAGNLIRYQTAVAAGRDIVDPDVREEIELTA